MYLTDYTFWKLWMRLFSEDPLYFHDLFHCATLLIYRTQPLINTNVLFPTALLPRQANRKLGVWYSCNGFQTCRSWVSVEMWALQHQHSKNTTSTAHSWKKTQAESAVSWLFWTTASELWPLPASYYFLSPFSAISRSWELLHTTN